MKWLYYHQWSRVQLYDQTYKGSDMTNTSCYQNRVKIVVTKHSRGFLDSSDVKKQSHASNWKNYCGLEISCFLAHEWGLSFQSFAGNDVVTLYYWSTKLWLFIRFAFQSRSQQGIICPYCLITLWKFHLYETDRVRMLEED